MEPPPLAAGRPAGEDAEREARGDRNRHMAEGEKHGPDFDANRFQVNAPQDVENEKQRETGGGCGEEPPFPASGTILRKRGGVLRGNAWQTESRKDDRGLGQGIGEPGEPPMQKGGRGTAEERRVRAAGVRERCHGESLQDGKVCHGMVFKTDNDMLSAVADGKVIAVGSDAIWSKRNRKRLEVFYCKWLWGTDLEDKVRVIALSPAFMGNDYLDLTTEQRENFKAGLLKFHTVNTRDEWTRNVINRDIMGMDYIMETNPDPVFLLNKLCDAEWDKRDSNLDSKGYYIISLPNNYFRQLGWLKRKWLSALKREINQRGYKMVELPTPDGYSGYDGFDYVVKYPIDPLQWYLWIKNAKGFIGLRFHAVVSSISAGTPFFSLE